MQISKLFSAFCVVQNGKDASPMTDDSVLYLGRREGDCIWQCIHRPITGEDGIEHSDSHNVLVGVFKRFAFLSDITKLPASTQRQIQDEC